MSIWLDIYEQGIALPTNSVKLYQYFIYLTICRRLITALIFDGAITDPRAL